MPNQATHSYTARRGAFAQAIEACEELISDYEKHRDHDGNVTGPDFNAMEIEAVKAAIVRIQCIETRELPPAGPSERIEGSEVWKVIDWCLDVAKLEDMIGAPIKDSIPYEIGVRRGLTIAQNILNGWRPKKMPPPATTSPIEKEKPCS